MAVRTSPFATTPRPDRTRVLADDVELCDVVPPDRVGGALAASVARLLEVRPGAWQAGRARHTGQGGYGLLVLDGLLIRRVGADGRYGAELLANGDILRPWQHDGEAVMPFETHWRVVGGARLAVLDLAWAARMAPYPQVGCELLGRATLRSQRLATMMAIVQQPRMDDRMRMLFWELADRFGTVHPDGVHVDLPLTHEVLSHLAAARRPSVSSSLGRLAREGTIRRNGRGWTLTGDPPESPDA